MRIPGDLGQDSARVTLVEIPPEARKVTIPEGDFLLSADFSRSGDALVLTGADGSKIVVADYFAGDPPPKLATATGEALSPELIATMVKLQAPLQLAQAGGSGAPGEPIGTVQEADGSVQVIRGGSTIELSAGDQVFLQDVLETGPGGSVSITFLDGTVFSVSENSRMVLNELIYNPGGSDNALSFSFLKGAFVFISGEIAQAQGEGMTVTTPIAVIGVRGTSVFMNVDLRQIINLIDPFTGTAGTPTISGDFGELTLGDAGQGLSVDPLAEAVQQFQASDNQLESFQNLVNSARSAGQASGRQVTPGVEEQFDPGAGPGEGQEGEGTGGTPPPPPGDETGTTGTPDESVVPGEEDPTLDSSEVGGDDPDPDPVPPPPPPPEPPEPPIPTPDPGDDDLDLGDGTPTEGPDTIIGSPGDDETDGLGGNDSITGEEGDDSLSGNDGDDSLDGGAGNDVIDGGPGDDEITFTVGDGSDSVDGGTGNDLLIVEGSAGADNFNLTGDGDADLSLTVGDDNLTVTAVEDIRVQGSDAADNLTVTGNFDGSGLDVATIFFVGEAGDDSLDASGISSEHRVDAQGGSGSDSLIGSPNDDILQGGGGDDSIDAGQGDDLILHFLGDGDDSVIGGFGDDLLTFAGSNAGELFAISAAGGPALTLEAGGDSLTVSEVEDLFILAFDGADQVVVTGDFTNTGLSTSTIIFDGGAGADSFDGSGITSGHSVSAAGGAGEDVLIGSDNDDALLGNADNDTMTGGLGNDSIDGGAGDDDVAVFDGDYSDYTVAESSSDITVTGPDGTDSLTGVEILRFDDRDVRTDGSVNNAPIGVDDTAAVDADDSVSITVLANDLDPDIDLGGPNSLTVTAVGAASAGFATIDPGNASVTYDPNGAFDSLNPEETGTATFSYTVSDGTDVDTATVTITVTGVADDPIAVDDQGAAFTTNEDTPFTTGNVLDNDQEVDSDDILSVQSIDSGGTIGIVTDNEDGTFDYDPNGQFEGLGVGETATTTFSYTIDDGNGGSASATVTITIDGVNDDPTAVDDQGAAFTTDEDTPFTTGNVLANDIELDTNDVLTVLSIDTTETAGIVTDNGDGSFDYDPDGQFDFLEAGQTATTTFGYTVSDGNEGTDTGTVTITITGVEEGNTPPVAQPDAFQVGEDEILNGTANVLDDNGSGVDEDPDGDSITVTAVNGSAVAVGSEITLTSGALLTLNGNGTFTYDSNDAFDGLGVEESDTDTFTYTISDGNGGTDTATVTITINGDNDQPTAVVDQGAGFTTDEESAFTTGNVLANDEDEDTNDILSVQSFSTAGTLGQVSSNGDGTFDYDPNGQFEALSAGELGTDSFTYTVSDGNGGSDTATVTITINGVNDDPTAVGDGGLDFTTDEDSAFTTGNVLTNDIEIDGDDVLSILSVDVTGTQGQILRNGDGTFFYNPNDQFEALSAGQSTTDSFSYTVSDGNGGTSTASVTITINGVNDDPTAVGDGGANFTTDEDSAFTTGNVLANDIEIDGDDVLSIQSIDLTGTQGLVTNNGDGTFGYDPNGLFETLSAGESATDTFSYTISDGNGGSDTATVTITINGVNDDPTAVGDGGLDFTTDEDSAFTTGNVLTNDIEIDGNDVLSILSVDVTGTQGQILRNGDGTFFYNPNDQFEALSAGQSTTDSFSYTVSDGNGGTSTATVTITINGVNDNPTAVGDGGANFTTDEETAFTTGNVLTNDVEIDGDDLLSIQSIDTGDTLGLVTNNGDGTFGYDPNGQFESLGAGETGTDSFTYTVSDGNGGTDTATVTITITGSGASDGDDSIVGTTGDDSLAGLAGDDDIRGLGGDDSLFGDEGDDSLRGDEGNDTAFGGIGNDKIFYSLGDGSDVIDGGADDDLLDISGTSAADSIVLDNLDGDATLSIDIGGDSLAVTGIEDIEIFGDGGDDTLTIQGDLAAAGVTGNTVRFTGGAGNDTVNASLLSSATAVVAIFAGNLADYLIAQDGLTLTVTDLVGSDGQDRVVGASGLDFADRSIGDLTLLEADLGVLANHETLIEEDDLLAIDLDVAPDQIVYTLDSLLLGGDTLSLNGTALGLGDSFTQQDVLDDLVFYADAGGGTASFNVDITAGGTTLQDQQVTVGLLSDGVFVFGDATDPATTNDLIIGDDAFGKLAIVGNGAVAANSVVAGNQPSGEGVIKVSGPNASLDVNGGGLKVGNEGRGELVIEGGAEVTSASNSFDNVEVADTRGGNGSLTVSGDGTTLRTAGTDNTVQIGRSGFGELDMNLGADLFTLQMEFGRSGAGIGVVSGAGTSIVLSNDDGLFDDPFAAFAGFLRLGRDPGSYGDLTLENQASITIRPGDLASGNDGTMSAGFVLGGSEGSYGAFVVDDASVESQGLEAFGSIGANGIGEMTVQNGGSVSVIGPKADFTVGLNGYGFMVLTGKDAGGTDSKLTVEGDATGDSFFVVGNEEYGAFVQSAEADTELRSGTEFIVGSAAGAWGFATVQGSDSTFAGESHLTVGGGFFDDQGTPDTGDDFGEAGADSFGLFEILDGASASFGGFVGLGSESVAGGVLVVSSASFTAQGLDDGLNGQSVIVGILGDGQLDIRGDSGLFTIDPGVNLPAAAEFIPSLVLGDRFDAYGELNIVDGTLRMTIGADAGFDGSAGFIEVGNFGEGEVNLDNGQILLDIANGAGFSIADEIGSFGAVFMRGSDALISGANGEVIDDFNIGQQGIGFLDARGGAALVANVVELGSTLSGIGIARLTGGGTLIDADAEVSVGEEGIGILRVRGGADIETGNFRVAEAGGSDGRAVFQSDGSTLTVDQDIDVGGGFFGPDFGIDATATGVLIFQGEGTATANRLDIGDETRGDGTVYVEGPSATVTIASEITVGNEGKGLLQVVWGGQVFENGTGTTRIGNAAGSDGKAVVLGEGSLLDIASDLVIGNGNFNDNGTDEDTSDDFGIEGAATIGRLDVRNGGQVDVDGEIQLGVESNAAGILFIGSGVVNAAGLQVGSGNGSGKVVLEGGGIFNATDDVPVIGAAGTLSGSGAFNGSVNVNGTVATGSAPGGLFIDGGLNLLSGSSLDLTFGNRSARLQVSGSASFDAASVLSVTFLDALDGYTPQFGDTLLVEALGGAVNLPAATFLGLTPPPGFGLHFEFADIAGDSGDDFARVTLVVDGTVVDPVAGGGFTVSADEAVLVTQDVTLSNLIVDSTGGGAALAAFNGDLDISGGGIELVGGSPSILTVNGVTNAVGINIDGDSHMVIGTGAEASIDQAVAVGDIFASSSAPSTLTVNGFLEADLLSIGVQSNVFGDVTVAGFNGTATSSQGPTTNNVIVRQARVGELGDGDLVVEQGGRMQVTERLDIAAFNNSNGDVLIRGDGAQVIVEDDLAMANGANASASVTLEDGGFLFARDLFGVGEADSTASITIDGFGSYMELNTIGWGNRGSVDLTISDGGRMTVGNPDSFNSIGNGGGSTATVLITGENSLLQVDDDLTFANGFVGPQFDTGTAGAVTTATVTVDDGARLEIGDSLFLANAFLADATMTVSGDTTEVFAAEIGVGQQGDGTLTIDQGADVVIFDETGGLFNSVANAEGSTGLLTVTGSGSTLEVGHRLIVGNGFSNPEFDFGTPGAPTEGTLEILNGGSVSIFDSDANAFVTFGSSSGATGRGTISGGGSSLDVAGATSSGVVVGLGGTGELDIADGGFLGTTFLTLAFDPGSQGTTTIDGDETEVHLSGADAPSGDAAFLTVGRSGTGTLTMTNGAVMIIEGGDDNFPGMQLGRNVDGQGTLNLESGSLIFIHSDLDGPEGSIVSIGRDGQGTMTISGGSIFVNDDKGFTAIGRESSGVGSVTVGDDASGLQSLFDAGEHLLIARDFNFGSGLPVSDPDSGGTGTLRVGANGLVMAEQILTGRDGRLEGAGRLIGDLFHEGGEVEAGLSVGTLDLDGLFDLDGGTVVSELGGSGAGQSDLIDVAEDMEITRGGFVLDLVGSYTPGAGDVIDLVATAGGVGFADDFDPADISFGIFGIDGSAAPLDFSVFGSNPGADIEIFVREQFNVSVRFNEAIATGDDAFFQGGTIDDVFEGDDGNDLILGGAGDDLLIGGAGTDSLMGEAGDDTMAGGAGDDSYAGGAGDDRYINVTDGGFDTVDLSLNTAGDEETAFVGSNIFDMNWGRDGDDLIIQAAVNGDYNTSENNNIRFLNHFGAGTVGLLYFEGDTPFNSFYTDPSNPEGVSLARIFTPQSVTGTDQGGFTEIVQGSDLGEIIRGNGGYRDFLLGDGGDDELIGSDGTEDWIRGGSGNDTAFGGSGDDQIRGGTGNDSLFGGGDFDLVDYRFADDVGDDNLGVTVDLRIQDGVQTQDVGNGLGVDLLMGFEGIRGTSFNDTLIGDEFDNLIRAGGGDDTVTGNEGDDDLRGDGGDDSISGGDGEDDIQGGAGDDDLSGGDDNDVILGGPGDDDTFTAAAGNDQRFDPQGGDDSIIGNNGLDTLGYELDEGPLAGVEIVLSAPGEGTATDRSGGTDDFTGIDIFIGSTGSDLFVGSSGFDVFLATPSNDEYFGNGGGDLVDFFILTFHGLVGGVTADLELGTASYTADGEAVVDSLNDIRDLSGTSNDDNFSGNDDDNFLRGRGGADSLFGDEGDDTFAFELPEEGVAVADNAVVLGPAGDIIADFDVNGDDVLQLTGANFSGLTGGDLISLGVAYDGTNSGQASGAVLVQDSNNNVIYDADVQTEGYTVLANTGVAIDSDDIQTV